MDRGRALGIPAMALLAHALGAHRAAHRLRQQRGIVAQHLQQWRIRRHLDGLRLAILLKGNALCHFQPFHMSARGNQNAER